MTLKFLGQEFETGEALKAAFPAFGGEGSIRAIRAGADTPLKVEQFCWERMQEGIRRSRAAAKKNAIVVNERAAKARERARKARSKHKAKAA